MSRGIFWLGFTALRFRTSMFSIMIKGDNVMSLTFPELVIINLVDIVLDSLPARFLLNKVTMDLFCKILVILQVIQMVLKFRRWMKSI